MLKIEDLEVSYGAVQALRGISMEVNDGEIVSLIGANGAGKTTTLHAITGLVPIKSGSVIYDGHDLRKTDPSRIVTMGLQSPLLGETLKDGVFSLWKGHSPI